MFGLGETPTELAAEDEHESLKRQLYATMTDMQLIMTMLLEIDAAGAQSIDGPLLDEAVTRSGHDVYSRGICDDF